MECFYDPMFSHPLSLQYNLMKEDLKRSGSVDADYLVSVCKFNTQVRNYDEHKYLGGWSIHRQRTDKTEPNATKSAKSVWESIVNSVEKETLLTAVEEMIDNGSSNANKR